MKNIFSQNIQKSTALLLTLIIIANLIFGCILIPTKKAKAQAEAALPAYQVLQSQFVQQALVPPVGPGLKVTITGDLPLSIWSISDGFWKMLDAIKQQLTSWSSVGSFAADLWKKADTWATRLINAGLLLALQTILQMITNEVIKWINGGGEPKFVTDWAAFLRDAANQAGGVFLDTLSGNLLCQPFAFQIKLALMPVSYYQRARCTLQDMGRNLQNFFNNFSSGGGWGTWLQIIQPQNNFYGSYLMALDEKTRRELEAAEKAKNEAIASGGFVGDKRCVEGGLEDFDTGQIAEKCSGAAACEEMRKSMEGISGKYSFKCFREAIVTPGTIVRDQAQEAIDTTRKTIYSMISGASSQLGPFAPYVQAILFALINRVVKEGLSAVASAVASDDKSYGPTTSNPNAPMPQAAPEIAKAADTTRIMNIQEILAASPALIRPLELLNENLQRELLPQQEQNLSILNNTRSAQTQTLSALVDHFSENCSLPAWASSQVLSTSSSGAGGVTIETIKITASGVGSTTIKRIVSGLGTTIETFETNPEVLVQLNAAENAVAATRDWLSKIDSAVSANRTALSLAEEYQAIVQKNNNIPSSESSSAQERASIAYNTALSATKEAAKSQEKNLTLLLADIQKRNIEVVEQSQVVQNQRAPLNTQLSSAQSRQSEAASSLNSCREQHRLQLEQQQQSQSSPFLFLSTRN